MDTSKKYQGKFFSILGDSISTFEGLSTPKYAEYYDVEKKILSEVTTYQDTWWGQVIQALGGKLLVNDSISGSTVTYHVNYTYDSYGCSEGRANALALSGISPDVIMIYIGTNDWGRGVAVTGISKDEKNLRVFSNAYQKMIDNLKERYKDAEIWCFTLSKSIWSKNEHFVFRENYSGYRIEDYCKAIEKIAEKNGCVLIDLLSGEPYDTIDGYHPNKAGMKTIAKNVLKNII